MNRWTVLVAAMAVGLFSLPTAGFAQGAPRRLVDEVLPVPPIPPAESSQTATGYEAAPTPNAIEAPVSTAQQSPRGPELMPTLMGPKKFYSGEGYLNGSTVQSEQQRNMKPVAGFNLTVPLR